MISRSSFLAFLVSIAVVACGGSADPPPPDEPGGGPAAVPPTITQQPQSVTVASGQPASFSVAAVGTAPLAYQWQRNGVAIAGATATTYAVAAATPADSGATFRAVVSNVAGSATSNAATLTVTVAPPVLTVTQQPVDLTVVAGAQAAFTVAATCSSGTLTVQWQRANGTGAFADVAGAVSTSLAFATVAGDTGARFRAALTCSQQAATTSNTAALTVTVPSAAVLSDVVANTSAQAPFEVPEGIAQAPDGSWVFATGYRLKRLSADLAAITPFAGTDVQGGSDGPAATATFLRPSAVAFDASGNAYIADRTAHTIRRVATDGTVSTVAGLSGTAGLVDGSGAAARFRAPIGIAVGPEGDLYVADSENHRIRRVTPAGVVTTYAGSSAGYADGAAAAAQFASPYGVAFAANGDLLAGDTYNNRVRRVARSGSTAGNVTTLAGDGVGAAPYPDGVGAAAGIQHPAHMVVVGNVLTLRQEQGLVRQIDLATAAVTTLAGSRTLGSGYSDGSAVTARVDKFAIGIATAGNGGFLLADSVALRTLSAAGDVRSVAHTLAGQPGSTATGTLDRRPLDPLAITVDPAGRVVVSEARGLVRRIAANGDVSLAAGLYAGGPDRDGRGSEGQFLNLGPALTADGAGNLWVADSNAVRRIAADNALTTVAGSASVSGYVDGAGAAARFNGVSGLAVTAGGVAYVADAQTVRRIDTQGNVTTYAGVSGQGTIVDGPIASARFNAPGTLALAPDGALYVLERSGGVIRRIAPDGQSVATVTGPTGVSAFAVDAEGTIHYGRAMTGGLFAQRVGGMPTQTTADVGPISSMVAVGPKNLLLVAGGRARRATLP